MNLDNQDSNLYLPLSNGDKNAAANQQIEVSDPDSESSQRIRRSLISSILVFVGATTLSGMIIWIGGPKNGRSATLH